jgi:hypothetical protein
MPDKPDAAPSGDAVITEANPCVSISRREFARRAALASAVVSIVPAAVAASAVSATSLGTHPAQQDTPPPAQPAAGSPQNSMPNAPRLSVESQSEADARFQAILVLYGSRFSGEQKNDLHRLCAVVQPSLDHIRAYKVENGDGPALYLKPQYEREKKPKVAPVAPGKAAAGPKAAASKSAPGGGAKKP